MNAKESSRDTLTLWMVMRAVLLLLVLYTVPFFVAGRWDWWGAWAYVALGLLSFVFSRLLAARRHPDLLVERGRFAEHKDAKAWDKKLSPWVGFFAPMLTLVTAGLNVRYGWPPQVLPGLQWGAFVVVALGYTFSSWALVANRFFSGLVRIQTDRGHHVVSSGPYRYVRHPGYAGVLFANLVLPLLLGSYWAFLPTALNTALLILRTALEDKTLHDELEGYQEYASKTRFRLVPGLW